MSDTIKPEEAIQDLAYLCHEVHVGRLTAEVAVGRARRVLALVATAASPPDDRGSDPGEGA